MNNQRTIWSLWSATLLAAAFAVGSGGCKRASVPPPAASADSSADAASASAPSAAPGVQSAQSNTIAPAEESEPAAQPRPRILLWVEGSPEENAIWRGWPVLVRTQTLAGDPPVDVQLAGPAAVPLVRAGSVWIIPPASSANLAVGNYTLSAAGQQITVSVTDPPKNLTLEQRSMQSALLVQSALAAGNAAEAKQAAEAWVEATPKQFEARKALGDALLASGDTAGALEAFNAAVQRVPADIDPPPAGLLGKVAALLHDRAASLATRPATAPTADENKYYELIEAGDQAHASGDRATAAKFYADADAWHRAHALTVSSLELRDKRAALGDASPR